MPDTPKPLVRTLQRRAVRARRSDYDKLHRIAGVQCAIYNAVVEEYRAFRDYRRMREQGIGPQGQYWIVPRMKNGKPVLENGEPVYRKVYKPPWWTKEDEEETGQKWWEVVGERTDAERERRQLPETNNYRRTKAGVPAFRGYNSMTYDLKPLRAEFPELRDFDFGLLAWAIAKAQNSIQAHLSGIRGMPKYQKRERWRCIGSKMIKAGNVKRSACGHRAEVVFHKAQQHKGKHYLRIKLKSPGTLPDCKPKEVRFNLTPNGLYVDLVCEVEREPLPKAGKMVGLDLGVNTRVALSDGIMIPKREPDDSEEKRLQRLTATKTKKRSRRRPSRKGSKTLERRKRRLAKLKRKNRIRRRQQDHRIAQALVRRYDHIAAEDLRIPNMTKSAAGTVEEPGRNVKQKRGLNRSISEQTWGQFLTLVGEKAEKHGGHLVRVPAPYTSRACSACGAIEPGARQGETFDCPACGYAANADVNAARNVLQLSLTEGGCCVPAPAAVIPNHLERGSRPEFAHHGGGHSTQASLPGFRLLSR